MPIRRYLPDDVDAVVDCWLQASRVGHPFLSEDELAEHRELVRKVYLPQAQSWVAEEDGRVVGFISLLNAFIGGLFVLPEYHGRGVGRNLIEHVAKRNPRLTVEVYIDNPIAPAFYRRCGFKLAGSTRFDDEGRPLELLVRRKR